MVYVFPDTNTLLHFNRLDQIDWLALLKCSDVTLMLAPVVVRELEQQKIQNHTRRIRERAQAVITWLAKFIECEQPPEIRPGVRLQFVRTSPIIDFAAHRLLHSIFDDELIASVIDFRDGHKVPARVATADMGMRLKLPAHNIEAFILPDTQRLPELLDDSEREIADLRRELLRHQNRRPKLSLAFANGASFGSSIMIQIDPQTIERPQRLVFGGYNFGGPTDQECAEYDFKVAAWINHMKSFCPCDLQIENGGSSEATDIAIDFVLPHFVAAVREDDLPAKPRLPRSPLYPEAFNNMTLASISTPRSATLPYRQPNGSIAFRIPQLVHNRALPLDRFYWKFQDESAAQNFSVDFVITFVEGIDPLVGKLNFVLS